MPYEINLIDRDHLYRTYAKRQALVDRVAKIVSQKSSESLD